MNRFSENPQAGISNVVLNSSGLLASWSENGYAMAVKHDTNGRPVQITATSAAESLVALLTYSADGVFTGLRGDSIPSQMLAKVVPMIGLAKELAAMGGPVLRKRITGGPAGGVIVFSGTNNLGVETVLDTYTLAANEVRTEYLWGDDSVSISSAVTSGAVTVEAF